MMIGYCIKRTDSEGSWLAGGINMGVPYVYLSEEKAQQFVDNIFPPEAPGVVVAVEYTPVREINPTDPGAPIREAIHEREEQGVRS